MTEVKVKRSQLAHFINTTPSTTATYVRMGSGIADMSVEMNPKKTDETYINADNASKSVDSYAPVIGTSMVATKGNAFFEYLLTLYNTRAVLSDAETDLVEVHYFETGGPTAYPATKNPVVISFDKWGGPGGEPVSLDFTIDYNGDPISGTFNASTSAFTAS